MGFVVRLVTNAWWACTYENAKKFLEELYSLGLKELNISYDGFHLPWLKKYGSEQNVINAAKAGVECGLNVVIAISKHAKSRISTKYTREVLLKKGIYKNVEFFEGFIAPLGRAANLDKDLFVRDADSISSRCTDIGAAISEICYLFNTKYKEELKKPSTHKEKIFNLMQ